MIFMKSGPLLYGKSRQLSQYPFITHGFSTRIGGVSSVSEGGKNELNIGLHVDDSTENVLENRRRFASTLGIEAGDIVAGEQVHGTNIRRVTGDDLGKGALSYGSSIEGTDGLITNEPGVPLLGFYADCTPIYLLDPVHKAIGLFHGGWKGTVGNIAGKGVDMMTAEFGSYPGDMVAFIGPRIDASCYEVGAEVIDRLRIEGLDKPPYLMDENRVSLSAINKYFLEKKGVRKIEIVPFNTGCNLELFFSHRMEKGKTGRMGALFMIK